PRFCFAVMPWVLNCGSLGISQEAFEPDIYTQIFPRGNMLDFALGLHAELSVVAICTADNAHPFNILHRECLNLLLLIAHQAESANATAIGEGDMLAIIVQLPASLLVFNRSVVVLKSGITLLSRFVLAAVLIEARDSKPCTISTSLSRL